MPQTRSLAIERRPTFLYEMIGNTGILGTVKTRLAGQVDNGWLISGPSGAGKTTLAEIIAREVNRGLEPNLPDLLDIRTINASADNGVDFVRELVQVAGSRPLYGKYRVLILNEAHRLTDAAQDTLLVALEEKQSSTVWILTTTDATKIRPALARRCAEVKLRGLTPPERERLIKSLVPAGTPHVAIEDAITKAGVDSPGLIAKAVDAFLNGTPPEDAVRADENEPEYGEIAKAVIAGNWIDVRGRLSRLKTTDVRGLRAVVAGFLNFQLLQLNSCPLADAFSAGARLLANNAYEDGVAKVLTTAALYETCKRVNAAVLGDF